jgi:hypothetical protein
LLGNKEFDLLFAPKLSFRIIPQAGNIFGILAEKARFVLV